MVDPRVLFLDEFRIMVLTHEAGTDAPKLTVFDTYVPQDNRGNSRRFNFSQKHQGAHILIHVDPNRYLGGRTRDEPLVADPTQLILVLEVRKPDGRFILLAVRIQALVEGIYPICPNDNVPWEEWGRGTVILEVPLPSLELPIYVHGTHLVVVDTSECGRRENLLRVFDFRRRECSTLPHWDEGGGTGRRILFGDGREFVLEDGGYGLSKGGMRSLSDGNFVNLVSHLPV